MPHTLPAFKNLLMKKTKFTLEDIFTSNFHVVKINIKALGFMKVRKIIAFHNEHP